MPAITRRPARLAMALVASLVLLTTGTASAVNGGGDITSGPPDVTNAMTATFTFADETDFCDLDGSGLSPCISPMQYTGLADGVHLFRTCGNYCPPQNPTITTWTWTIDTQAPQQTTMSAPAAPFQSTNSAVVSWAAGTDNVAGSGIATYQLRDRKAPYTGAFGAFTLPPAWQDLTTTSVSSAQTPGNTYCYSARATDQAANPGQWSAEKCTAEPLDDRALTRSTGWILATDSSYYRHTIMVTKKLGATLSVPKAVVDRIAIIATKCPDCGSVSIKVGTTVIARLSLFASTTKVKQLVALKPFSLRTGAVTITVTSSHQSVQIDALGLSRR
jgi:hypothetical protein